MILGLFGRESGWRLMEIFGMHLLLLLLWLFTFFLNTGAIERSADLFCLRRWMQLTADE
jgi:hypothetical protein